MSTDAPEVWWEGKAFRRWGHFDADKEQPEVIQEFRGENAEADARAWFEVQVHAPEVDAVYSYRHVRLDASTVERTLVQSWGDNYLYFGTDEDDDDEWWSDMDDDGDGPDSALDRAAGECSMMADGQCGQAGSEHCDFECPFRDGEIVEVDGDETKGP